MLIDASHEWWKIKVYNEVVDFLKHPSLARKQQLDIVLTSYQEVFKQSVNTCREGFSEMELTMNDQ